MKSCNTLLALSLFLFCMLFVVSCNLGNKQYTEYSFEDLMTPQDTIEVEELIATFYSYVINKEFDEAAAMLYRVNPDSPEGQPILLDNEQLNEVIATLQTLPAIGYGIEYMKFYDGYENEVMCHVIVAKGENGMPDVTTKMFFKPLFYLGKWSLSIMNYSWGDRGIVDPSDRDSLARRYRAYHQRDSI